MKYFQQAFILVNKSLDIYLIGISLSLVGLLSQLNLPISIQSILSLVNLALIPISISFTLSIPILLLWKQENKFTYSTLKDTVLKNIRRIIIPSIILFILFSIAATILLITYAVTTVGTGDQAQPINVEKDIENAASFLSGWSPIMIAISVLFSIVTSLFVFTPIYFSVEGKGLIKSAINSVGFSFKNLSFIFLVIIIWLLNSLIIGLLPIQELWAQFLTLVVSEYVVFVTMAAALLFYKTNNQLAASNSKNPTI